MTNENLKSYIVADRMTILNVMLYRLFFGFSKEPQLAQNFFAARRIIHGYSYARSS